MRFKNEIAEEFLEFLFDWTFDSRNDARKSNFSSFMLER